MGFDVANIGYQLSVWLLPVLIAVTLHEAAHGWVAWKLGDDTAYLAGRVSFNPLKHIDPMGTIILPVLMLLGSGGRMMFGFAKPVPVNFMALNGGKRGMVLVALAGPGSNLLIAFIAALLLHSLAYLSGDVQAWVGKNLINAVWINLLLCVFNLLPLLPLDGGRVLVGLLPDKLAWQYAKTERYGFFILIGGIFLLPYVGERLGYDLNIFAWLVIGPAEYLLQIVAMLSGNG